MTGALLSTVEFSWPVVGFALLLFLVIRPLAVAPFALAFGMNKRQAAMVSWFGIRGIGSLYYLFYAINQGVTGDVADWMLQVVLCVIAASIILHGISVTPMMRHYAEDAAT